MMNGRITNHDHFNNILWLRANLGSQLSCHLIKGFGCQCLHLFCILGFACGGIHSRDNVLSIGDLGVHGSLGGKGLAIVEVKEIACYLGRP